MDLLFYFFYAFIGCFLYVPQPGIKPATLIYWDDALTNGATWPGLDPVLLTPNLILKSVNKTVGITSLSVFLSAKQRFCHRTEKGCFEG